MTDLLVLIGCFLLFGILAFIAVFLPLWLISTIVFYIKIKRIERKERKQYNRGDYGL